MAKPDLFTAFSTVSLISGIRISYLSPPLQAISNLFFDLQVFRYDINNACLEFYNITILLIPYSILKYFRCTVQELTLSELESCEPEIIFLAKIRYRYGTDHSLKDYFQFSSGVYTRFAVIYKAINNMDHN